MADDNYEILPHQLLADLKYDVEALKKKLSEPDAKVNELILEIESVKDSIHELSVIFQKALEEVKGDDSIAKTMKNLQEKTQSVISQNETIAKGMIAISDKLEDFMAKQTAIPRMETPMRTTPIPESSLTTPIRHTIGLPQPGIERNAPRPSLNPAFSSPRSGIDLPPPPPSPPGKKHGGIFK